MTTPSSDDDPGSGGPARTWWSVYLLVDPSVPPSSHREGEVFYVGVCPGRPAVGVDLSDLAAAELVPAGESTVVQRIRLIEARGSVPVVDMVGLVGTTAPSRSEVVRTAAAVAAVLVPAPLNASVPGLRRVAVYRRSTYRWLAEARPVMLPDGWQALIRRVPLDPHTSLAVEGAELVEMTPGQLLAENSYVPALRSFLGTFVAEARRRYFAGCPLVYLLVLQDRFPGRAVPRDLVLGVWKIADLVAEHPAKPAGEPDRHERRVRVVTAPDDPETVALRRHLLH